MTHRRPEQAAWCVRAGVVLLALLAQFSAWPALAQEYVGERIAADYDRRRNTTGAGWCERITVTNISDAPLVLSNLVLATCGKSRLPRESGNPAELLQLLDPPGQEGDLTLPPGRSHILRSFCSPACITLFKPRYCVEHTDDCEELPYPGFP